MHYTFYLTNLSGSYMVICDFASYDVQVYRIENCDLLAL